MIDFIKKYLFWLWNPNRFTIRDSGGKVVEDWRSRAHSKKVQKQLDSGEVLLHGFHGQKIQFKKDDGPRHYKVEKKGKVILKKTKGFKDAS